MLELLAIPVCSVIREPCLPSLLMGAGTAQWPLVRVSISSGREAAEPGAEGEARKPWSTPTLVRQSVGFHVSDAVICLWSIFPSHSVFVIYLFFSFLAAPKA